MSVSLAGVILFGRGSAELPYTAVVWLQRRSLTAREATEVVHSSSLAIPPPTSLSDVSPVTTSECQAGELAWKWDRPRSGVTNFVHTCRLGIPHSHRVSRGNGGHMRHR